jgi:uncharacterized membrane protein
MTRLVLGLLLWSVVHFVPGIAANFKKSLISRFGENPYKGVFALLMVVALYLIISGWQSMTPVAPEVLELIFTPPDWGVYVAGLLVLIGFILFLAPYPRNNFRRIMRHPQLVGVVSFGVGHLFAVGTARAIVLFAGLTIWAIIEIVLINRRDGEWIKPARVPFNKDASMVLFSVLVYMAFLYTHHMMFGGSPLTQ